MTQEGLTAFYGDLAGETEDSFKFQYLFAKRRFRRLTNKRPRQQRFPRRPASSSWDLRFSGKGKGKHGHFGGKKGHYAGFPLGPSSLAGGKSKGKGGGTGNPRGKDGETMRCHGCGSSDHLIGRCPTKGGGKDGKNFFTADTRTVSFAAASSDISRPTTGLNAQPHWYVDPAGHWQTDEQRLADDAGADMHESPHAVDRFGRQFAHATPPQRTYERYALNDDSDDEEDDVDEADASSPTLLPVEESS